MRDDRHPERSGPDRDSAEDGTHREGKERPSPHLPGKGKVGHSEDRHRKPEPDKFLESAPEENFLSHGAEKGQERYGPAGLIPKQGPEFLLHPPRPRETPHRQPGKKDDTPSEADAHYSMKRKGTKVEKGSKKLRAGEEEPPRAEQAQHSVKQGREKQGEPVAGISVDA